MKGASIQSPCPQALDSMPDFDIAVACEWVEYYLIQALSENELIEPEYQSKAFGEFSLLLNLSRRHEGRIPRYLESTLTKLVEPIGEWAKNRAIQKSDEIYGLCTTLGFLGLSECEAGTRLETEIEGIFPSFFSTPRSAEHAFYLDSIGVPVPELYWQKQTKKLFDRMLKNGASMEDLYEYTHIVFFATSFRLRPCPDLILPYLSSVTSLFFNMAESSENWDAQIEVCAACLCLGKGHEEMKVIQDEDGWVLSDGRKRALDFDERTLYSLFHTTCISLLYGILSEASC